MRRIAIAAAFVGAVMLGGAANAYDIGVSVNFENVDDDRRFDPLAVFDTLGRPDLFFCYRQGTQPWRCSPDTVQDRLSPVAAARLPCRNALSCLFQGLPISAGQSFQFELRDADVSRNEIIESGSCLIRGDRIACDTRQGNATLTIVTEGSEFEAPISTSTEIVVQQAQQQTAATAPPRQVSDRRERAFLKLAATIERDYRNVAPEQNFAFCKDPETAIQRYIDAGGAIPNVQALSRDPEIGWRLSNRLAEALIRGVGSAEAATAANRIVADFAAKDDLFASAVSEIERRPANRQLATESRARQIFRDRCL